MAPAAFWLERQCQENRKQHPEFEEKKKCKQIANQGKRCVMTSNKERLTTLNMARKIIRPQARENNCELVLHTAYFDPSLNFHQHHPWGVTQQH